MEVADHFLKKGLIVYTKGPPAQLGAALLGRPAGRQRRRAAGVLINGGSASASEIVAGACRITSAGSSWAPTASARARCRPCCDEQRTRLKLTTALYFTPNGRSIQAQGIVPDVEVARAKLTRESDDPSLKEADLQGHLGNGNGGADRPTQSASGKPARPQDDDYQLSSAEPAQGPERHPRRLILGGQSKAPAQATAPGLFMPHEMPAMASR